MTKTDKYDFHIHQGNSGTVQDERGIVLELVQEDDTPIDLTGWNVKLTARSADKTLTLTSIDGDVILDAAAGAITIPITIEHSNLFRPNTTVKYQIIRYMGEKRRLILAGRIVVVEGMDDGA